MVLIDKKDVYDPTRVLLERELVTQTTSFLWRRLRQQRVNARPFIRASTNQKFGVPVKWLWLTDALKGGPRIHRARVALSCYGRPSSILYDIGGIESYSRDSFDSAFEDPSNYFLLSYNNYLPINSSGEVAGSQLIDNRRFDV